jgi:hypothetical protein
MLRNASLLLVIHQVVARLQSETGPLMFITHFAQTGSLAYGQVDGNSHRPILSRLWPKAVGIQTR